MIYLLTLPSLTSHSCTLSTWRSLPITIFTCLAIAIPALLTHLNEYTHVTNFTILALTCLTYLVLRCFSFLAFICIHVSHFCKLYFLCGHSLYLPDALLLLYTRNSFRKPSVLYCVINLVFNSLNLLVAHSLYLTYIHITYYTSLIFFFIPYLSDNHVLKLPNAYLLTCYWPINFTSFANILFTNLPLTDCGLLIVVTCCTF